MALTATQRKKLKAAGFDDGDLAEIDKAQEEEEEAPPARSGRRARRRVFILEGRDADEFMAGLSGNGDADAEEDEETEEAPKPKRKKAKASEETSEDEEEEEETEELEASDEKPPSGPKYFRG